jgi:sugar lactone lactonase YvrE
MTEPRVLLDGLGMGESPRWHHGRLWLCDWGTSEIVITDLDGNRETIGDLPPGMGWSIGWLEDGSLLMTSNDLLRRERDGSWVVHAKLSELSSHGWSEMTIDGRGNVYINTINFDFETEFMDVMQEGRAPGMIALVTPDGDARQVAGELRFTNGMVVTPDNSTLIISESFAQALTAFDVEPDGRLSNRRTWAQGDNVGPDGICLDAEGAIWTSSAAGTSDVIRLREGGEILQRFELPDPCFATMLGGPERRTLFMVTNPRGGTDSIEDNIAKRAGKVLAVEVDVPGAGWP